ncbi:MAG: DUF4350 domain-containing protein, partial [Chloroflexi bacterium]|nr:DUF4350 domain-containing protein [Chloroflexota bacterium]
MRPSREIWLPILLLMVLGAAIVFAIVQRAEAAAWEHGSIYNDRAEGAQALQLWLEELGYNTIPLEESYLWVFRRHDILFVLSPYTTFSGLERDSLERWLKRGGVLIIAQTAPRPVRPLADYDIGLTRLPEVRQTASLNLPALDWPSVGEAPIQAEYALTVDCDDVVIHMGDCDEALLVSFGYGQGQVIVLSSLYPFTNDGLRHAANARLVQNLVQAGAESGGDIFFDEVHHRPPPPIISYAWLRQTAEGRAFLYAAVIIFFFLLLHGRRFGPVRKLPEQLSRRTNADFITAVAGLHRQAATPDAMPHHYWQRRKQALAHHYQLDPALPDAEFLPRLTPYFQPEEIDRLAVLLSRADSVGR